VSAFVIFLYASFGSLLLILFSVTDFPINLSNLLYSTINLLLFCCFSYVSLVFFIKNYRIIKTTLKFEVFSKKTSFEIDKHPLLIGREISNHCCLKLNSIFHITGGKLLVYLVMKRNTTSYHKGYYSYISSEIQYNSVYVEEDITLAKYLPQEYSFTVFLHQDNYVPSKQNYFAFSGTDNYEWAFRVIIQSNEGQVIFQQDFPVIISD